jgi:hypothetical protein
MRWYNPKLEVFEWREVPESDDEALGLLYGSHAGESCAAAAYREWRGLGASIHAALIRAGEAAEAREVETGP